MKVICQGFNFQVFYGDLASSIDLVLIQCAQRPQDIRWALRRLANTDQGFQPSLQMWGIPVNVLIKCRENTADGRKRKTSLYICTDCAFKKRSCSVLRRAVALNGSQCLNRLTVVVLSSRTQSAAPGPPGYSSQKAVCYKETFFQKKGIFEKTQIHDTFHIRTLTDIEADAERRGFSVRSTKRGGLKSKLKCV